MANARDLSWSALVIDDDAGVRSSLRLGLESDGARVLGVATPSAASEALERSSSAAVFLDLWLGRESGLDVLPEILRRRPNTGVIVITPFASFETAVQAMKLGAVDYLPKPFTPDQVRHTACRVIEAKRLHHRVSELQERLEETDVDGFFDSESPAYHGFLKQAGRA